jgi:hypothetical protein
MISLRVWVPSIDKIKRAKGWFWPVCMCNSGDG